MESLLMVVVMLAIVIPIILYTQSSHDKQIREKVAEMGGIYVSHNRGWGLFGCGPFRLVGKGQVVYRINYRIGTDNREGWVKFGGWGGADWRL